MTTTADPTTDRTDAPPATPNPTPETGAGEGSGGPRRRVPREVALAAAPVAVAGLLLARMTLGVVGMAAVVTGAGVAAIVWWRVRRRRAAADAAKDKGKSRRDRRGGVRRGGRLGSLLASLLPTRIADRLFGRTATYKPGGTGRGGLPGRRAGGPSGRGGLLGRLRSTGGGTGGGKGSGGGLLGRKKAARAARATTGATGGRKGGGGLLGRKTSGRAAGARPGSSGGRAGGGRSGSRAGTTGGGRGRGSTGGRAGGRAAGGGRRTSSTTGSKTGTKTGGKRGRLSALLGRRDRTARTDPWMNPDGARYLARFLPTRTPTDPDAASGPAPDRDPDTAESTPVSPGETPDSDPRASDPPAPTPKGDEMTADYMGTVKPVTHATDARRIIGQMPDRLDEVVTYVERQHTEIKENVDLNPSLIDAMDEFAVRARVTAQGYDAVNSGLLTGHAEDFHRIDEGDPRKKAWNIL